MANRQKMLFFFSGPARNRTANPLIESSLGDTPTTDYGDPGTTFTGVTSPGYVSEAAAALASAASLAALTA